MAAPTPCPFLRSWAVSCDTYTAARAEDSDDAKAIIAWTRSGLVAHGLDTAIKQGSPAAVPRNSREIMEATQRKMLAEEARVAKSPGGSELIY